MSVFCTIVMSPQYLWCNVVWSATEGRRGVSGAEPLFAHPVVSELHMPINVKQYVVELQITIDNA